ncbi:MAG: ABC transporter permease [Spirochaetales bacterium]|nr:ABC transporter permease [Spirochaetales bacterium]
MKLPLAVHLGLRNLMGKRGRISPNLLGSVLGIGLSLIPLLVVLEVADGMIEGITRRYLEVGTYHAQVILPEAESAEGLVGLAETLRLLPEVTQVIPEQQGIGLLYTPEERTAVTIRAVPAELYRQDEDFRRYFQLSAGSFDLDSPGAILLGREVAGRLGAGVGDPVKLLTLASSSSGRRIPRVVTLSVQGVFHTGYQELDKLWVYVPAVTGERLLSASSGRRFIGLKVKDPFDRLERQLQEISRVLPAHARLYSWYSLERANYQSFQTTKTLLVFIMALIVVVATVNISSALVMVVIEKNQEIAILKSMGMPPGKVSGSFVVTGLATGLCGAAIGLALGLLISLNINSVIHGIEGALNLAYRLGRLALEPLLGGEQPPVALKFFDTQFYLEEIPIRVRLGELFAVAAATVGLSALAAYLPARSAARVRPLEVLRKI